MDETKKYVARFEDGRQVEITLRFDVARMGVGWTARLLGDPASAWDWTWPAWKLGSGDTLYCGESVALACAVRAHCDDDGPPVEVLPAGEPARADLVADVARLRGTIGELRQEAHRVVGWDGALATDGGGGCCYRARRAGRAEQAREFMQLIDGDAGRLAGDVLRAAAEYADALAEIDSFGDAVIHKDLERVNAAVDGVVKSVAALRAGKSGA